MRLDNVYRKEINLGSRLEDKGLGVPLLERMLFLQDWVSSAVGWYKKQKSDPSLGFLFSHACVPSENTHFPILLSNILWHSQETLPMTTYVACLFLFLKLFLLNVLCLHVYLSTTFMASARRGYHNRWNGSYTQLWAAMWVLGISGRAAIVLIAEPSLQLLWTCSVYFTSGDTMDVSLCVFYVQHYCGYLLLSVLYLLSYHGCLLCQYS